MRHYRPLDSEASKPLAWLRDDCPIAKVLRHILAKTGDTFFEALQGKIRTVKRALGGVDSFAYTVNSSYRSMTCDVPSFRRTVGFAHAFITTHEDNYMESVVPFIGFAAAGRGV